MLLINPKASVCWLREHLKSKRPITSTIHVLILVPVFFVLMKEHALRKGTLRPSQDQSGNF